MSTEVERLVRLRQEIAHDEAKLSSAVRVLGRAVERTVNPFSAIEGNEWVLLVSGAFLVGFWLGRPGQSPGARRR